MLKNILDEISWQIEKLTGIREHLLAAQKEAEELESYTGTRRGSPVPSDVKPLTTKDELKKNFSVKEIGEAAEELMAPPEKKSAPAAPAKKKKRKATKLSDEERKAKQREAWKKWYYKQKEGKPAPDKKKAEKPEMSKAERLELLKKSRAEWRAKRAAEDTIEELQDKSDGKTNDKLADIDIPDGSEA